MLTKDGPKVIEYNCRFGDPETQVCCRFWTPTFSPSCARWKKSALRGGRALQGRRGLLLVIASGGYPEAYEKGKVIDLGGADALDDTWVFHSGTAVKDGHFVTNGGRVLGVTATGDTLKAAIDRAYDAARMVHFDGMFMRSDIGKRALEVEGYHG